MGGAGEKEERSSLARFKEQAEITAKDVIRQLEEAIDHGHMTYFELNDILRSYLKKSMDEMMIFKPEGIENFSLRKLGLKNIYRALEEMGKKEQKEARKQGSRHDHPN